MIFNKRDNIKNEYTELKANGMRSNFIPMETFARIADCSVVKERKQC